MFAKKNLVAAAALLAIAGAAQADVKLYGYVDAAIGSFGAVHAKTDPSSQTTKVESGTLMTSFIGFSGSEDLGGGLKAEFVLESFLANDTGEAAGLNTKNKAGGFWSRGSNIALSGGFGKVALGQYDNPLFTSAYTYNPFGSSMPLSPTMRHLNYVGQLGNQLGAGVGFDTGWVNSVTYESPVVQGFNAVAQYGLKESTKSDASNSYALAGFYNAGPFSAGLTFVKSGVSDSPAPSPYIAWQYKQSIVDLGASYDLGAAKLFGQFTSIDSDKATDGAAFFANKFKDTIYQIGVSAPVNDKLVVMASFGSLKHKPEGQDSVTDNVLSLGGDYALSKRTGVYAAVMYNSRTDMESGKTVAVGVKHSF